MNKIYLRIIDRKFVFVIEGIHDIKQTDIKITTVEYNKFFELQSEGKQFKLKEKFTGNSLFDYVEEYTEEVL